MRTRSRAEIAIDQARAYVWAYLRRGAIVPAAACEACGFVGRLVFWHPSPANYRVVAWLCRADRRRMSAQRDPLMLRWEWPGTGPLQPPRVVPIDRQPGHPQVISAPEPNSAAPDTVDREQDSREKPSRMQAEDWLMGLSPAAAEAQRMAAASIFGLIVSRESPIYGQRLIAFYTRSLKKSEQ